ncbi:site-2 protease family protein [Priestia aryabhattai]
MKDNKLKKSKGLWGGALGVGLLAVTKMKWLIAILKFAKFSTIISLVLSLFSYGLVFGWRFAIALIYLLLVHELGHYVACKIKGIPVKPTLFIPFIGAAVRPARLPKTVAENAFIAYMGPIFGLLSILPAIPLYLLTENPFWIIVLSVGSILNLFNLIPAGVLDGGKIVAGISTKLWFLGLVAMAAYVVYTKSIFAGFIFVLGILQLWHFYTEKKELNKKKELVQKAKDLYNILLDIKKDSEQFTLKINEYTNTYEFSKVLLDMYKEIQTKSNEEDPCEEVPLQYLEKLKGWIEEQQASLTYQESYETISKKSRIITLVIYILLLVLLSIGLDVSKEMIESHPEVKSFSIK